jgi:hypothetical protein
MAAASIHLNTLSYKLGGISDCPRKSTSLRDCVRETRWGVVRFITSSIAAGVAFEVERGVGCSEEVSPGGWQVRDVG